VFQNKTVLVLLRGHQRQWIPEYFVLRGHRLGWIPVYFVLRGHQLEQLLLDALCMMMTQHVDTCVFCLERAPNSAAALVRFVRDDDDPAGLNTLS
jgi:hypothetical protein